MIDTLAIHTYKPSNFEVKLYGAITNTKNKAVDKVKQAYNSLKDKFQNIKNKASYIPEYTNPHDSHATVIVSRDGEVFSDAQSDNTTGHLEQLAANGLEIYVQKEVNEFRQYLGKTAPIIGVEASNEKSPAVASVCVFGLVSEVMPVFDTDFYLKLSSSARKYGVSQEVKKLYTALHETAHMHKSLKNIIYNAIYNINPVPSETLVEAKVYEFAMKKASEATTTEEKEKWIAIAEVAESRYSRVKEIYRGKDAKKEKNIEEKVKEEKTGTKETKSKYSKEENYQEKNIDEESTSEETDPESSDLEARVQEEAPEGCEEAACEADSG